jgi:lipopolysaccharide/colanic/teichoic acid biosynthesis glycosyltransferase
MTANSQLVSVKLIQGLAKRGLIKSPRQLNQEQSQIRLGKEFYKRAFDILFSASVLIIFSPLYLLLTILIGLSSPGPIFYVQDRVGKDFRHFKCIKFRTMVVNADQVLEDMLTKCPHRRQEFEDNFKLKDDPRITWIGKFLRFTSLDEFPQFWNVLKGEMSVVGPRPLVPEELHKYGIKMEKVLVLDNYD